MCSPEKSNVAFVAAVLFPEKDAIKAEKLQRSGVALLQPPREQTTLIRWETSLVVTLPIMSVMTLPM